MKLLHILLISAFMLMLGMAFANANLQVEISAVSKELSGSKLPSAISTLFGNERINIYIAQETGSQIVVGVVTEDKVMKNITIGELSNPTLRIYTTEVALNEIRGSSNPLKALQEALKNKKITYTGVGFANKIKFSFTSLFSRIAGWLSPGEEATTTTTATGTPAEITIIPPANDASNYNAETEQTNTPTHPEINKTELDNSSTSLSNASENVSESKTYTVNVEAGGFKPAELRIKRGDTVEWEIIRSGNLHLAMILGTQNCVSVKSKILDTGKSFSWTFNRTETCTYVDGITTTQVGKVIVE